MFSFVRSHTRQQRPVFKIAADVVALSTLVLSQSGCGAAPRQSAPQAAPKTVSKAAPKAAPVSTMTKPQRLLMAHYMPWYESKPVSGHWGWHWTMNHFDPDKTASAPVAGQQTTSVAGQPATGEAKRQEGASQFRPLIGLYDSGDPDTLKCQVMLMKLSGIDGVIFDWYGNEDYNDYAILNRNTQRLIPLLQQAGLRFAICFEDQSVAQKIKGGRFTEAEAVPHAQRLMEWMNQNFFLNPAYLKSDGHPVLLTFGEPYYKDAQWNDIFSVLPTKPLYLTEHVIRAQTAAQGGFDWPVPNGGAEGASKERAGFYERAKSWPYFMAAAYPRFQDIYAQAGVQKSWGSIADSNGSTYSETLTRALQSNASVVQLVTWNDWGEGTQIEPSVEFGFRDLEVTQKLRRQYLEPKFAGAAPDLQLPVEWYRLKKKYQANKEVSQKLDAVFSLVNSGHVKEAKSLLTKYK